MVLQSIIGGSSQVVSGAIYRIKVELVESTCRNIDENDGKGIKLCPARDDHKMKLCTVSIWTRPWLPEGEKTIIDITCL